MHRIFKKIKDKALLVVKPANVTYLSGHDFTGDAYVLLHRKQIYVLTDRRYEFEKLKSGVKLVIVRKSLVETLKQILGRQKTLLVEGGLSLKQAQSLQNFKLQIREGLVEELRAVKSSAELQIIREAARILSAGFCFIAKELKPGRTEQEIAWCMEKFLREHGADALAFPMIVASGENASRPHASPTKRKLRAGDLVKIDCGVKLRNYHSDMTRTFKLGKITKEQTKILNLVEQAQKAVLKLVRAGVTVKSLDQAARSFFHKAGYGKHFSHALGHGVGLEIHEAPRLSSKSKEVLRAGMVIAIEPGIYLNDCGARWEDLFLVTINGAEKLT